MNCAICDKEFEYSAVHEIDLCKKCYRKIERQRTLRGNNNP